MTPIATARHRPRAATSVLALLAALAATACGGASPSADGPPAMRVAVLQYGDVTDAIELVSSSALGTDLALRAAVARGELGSGSDLAFVETAGRDPVDVLAEVRELAEDPSVAAAVVTPFVDAPAAERAFLEAGVPVFSFSGLGGVLDDPRWRRLVPTADAEGTALAALGGPDACAAGGSTFSPPVPIEALAGSPEDLAEAVADRCAAVVWLGDTDGALALARALRDRAADVGLVVSAAARTERLPREGYPATLGTKAAVPCPSVELDVATSARRFVHDYQAAHGVPPGLCAAEGYGLGRALIEAWLDDPGRPLEPASIGVPGAEVIPLDPGATPREAAVERIVGVRWVPDGGDTVPGP